MLHIKRSHHLYFPHIQITPLHNMQLSTVPVDDGDDELSRAIVADPIEHDNNWELAERPDTGELKAFWDNVEKDVKNDPEWFRFID